MSQKVNEANKARVEVLARIDETHTQEATAMVCYFFNQNMSHLLVPAIPGKLKSLFLIVFLLLKDIIFSANKHQ